MQTFFPTERILMQRLFTGTADMAGYFDLLKQYQFQQGGHGMVEGLPFLSFLGIFSDRKHPDRRLFEQPETRYREQGLSY